VALPLPGTSAMLAMGLVSLGGLALLRKKRLA
jgi:LPXTG-motif cell wall-anchored protein